MFKSGWSSWKEGENTTAGQGIVLEELKSGAFKVLLEFLYAHRFPEREDCGHGLGAGRWHKWRTGSRPFHCTNTV